MNRVSLVGRLTRDVEVRYSQSATPVAVARTGIAVNKKFKRQGEADADFINIVAYGKVAELMEKHLGKGREVAIGGRIQTGSYVSDGKKIYTFDIVVEDLTFIGSKGQSTTVNESTTMEEEDDLPF